MKSVDTNILARYVVGDDPRQAEIAADVLTCRCYIADTVLLELAWLLSSRYGMERQDLAATLSDLVDLPNISVSDSELVDWAISRFAAGADFPDMMHLLSGRHADSFVSFERELAKRAGVDTPIAVELAG